MKKILVTGASGFLGRFLVPALQDAEVITLNSKNCDLTQKDSLRQFDHIEFDLIFHLAAWTQAGDFCLKYPGQQWLINQEINTHVLKYWQQVQPQALLVCMGTSCAYDPTLPLEEEYYLNGQPIESLFTYAMTKRMLLTGLQALSKEFNLHYLYLIPSTLYGPSYHSDGRQLHFIFDLIRKILLGKYRGEEVILWGDGYQKRELIHVKDVVKITLELIEKGITNTCINIGAGSECTIREFAERICQNIGYPNDKIVYDETKYVGARSKLLSIKKLKRLLPSFAPIPQDVGLRETIEWFQKTQMPMKNGSKCTFVESLG